MKKIKDTSSLDQRIGDLFSSPKKKVVESSAEASLQKNSTFTSAAAVAGGEEKMVAVKNDPTPAIAATPVLKQPSPAADFTDAKVLLFEVEDEKYALELKFVDEIVPMMKIKPVPRSPDFIEGVVQIRDRVIPVLDLKKYFSYPREHYYSLTRIAILDIHDRKLGVILDNVTSVTELSQKQLKKTVMSHDHAQFVEGMAEVDQSLIQLLEVDKLLDDSQLAILSKVR
jgi:purine-binding chemotaxis protein CheW